MTTTRETLPHARRASHDQRRLPVYAAGAGSPSSAFGLFDEVVDVDTVWAGHAHPTHELLWNERGVSTATVDRRTWSVTPRFGLWMPAGLVHSGAAAAGTWYRAIHFGIHSMTSIADVPTTVEITPLLRLLLERLGEPGLTDSSRDLTQALVLDVLAPSSWEVVVFAPTSPLLAPIVDAVRDAPDDPRTLADWSLALGVSTRTLTRAFRSETGTGFSQWVATVRAQHAVDLLGRGNEIDDVARAVGYSSTSAFGAAFRRVTGATPGALRDVRFATKRVC